jgi:hypothetical protein
MELSLLKLGEKEVINENGFVLRELDSNYVKILPKKIQNANMEDKLNYITKRLTELNAEHFPRKVVTKARSPFSIIPNDTSSKLQKQFFEDDKLTIAVSTDFEGGSVRPTIIQFESDKSRDQRIQISFTKDSILHKTVQTILSDGGLVDKDTEFIEDVSLIIGGTMNQKSHADIPRLFCYFLPNNTEFLSHEINRQDYNEAMMTSYAPSSILTDLSSDKSGLYLSLPTSAVSVQNDDKKIVTIKFNNTNDKFSIKQPTGKKDKMVTILVKSGCQFAGDFEHAGADNASKTNKKKFSKLFNELHPIICDPNNKNMYKQVLDLLNTFPELSKITRFFCKTIPKNYDQFIPRTNIYYPAKECEYIDDRVKNIEDNKKKRKATTPTRNRASSSTPKRTKNTPTRANSKATTPNKLKSPSKVEKKSVAPSPATRKRNTAKKVQAPNLSKVPKKIPPKYKRFNKKTKARIAEVTEDDVILKAAHRVKAASNNKSDADKEKKRLQKQAQRAKQSEDQVKQAFSEKAKFIEIKSDCIICKKEAFAAYIDVDNYEKSVETMDKDEFYEAIKDLWEDISNCVHVAQKQWWLNITRNTHVNKKYYTKIPEWAFDLDFSAWRKEGVDEELTPMASWLLVEKSKHEEHKIGVFAARQFVAGELIGLFYGLRIVDQSNPDPTEYALESRYGIYDPKRGLDDSGRYAPYMAMHLVVEVNNDDMVNAKMYANFLVRATKDIDIGDELYFQHDANEVWRPRTEKSHSL